MSIFQSMTTGIRRALGSPSIVLWFWVVNLALALPAVWALSASIDGSVSNSLVSDHLRDGFDMTWFGEYGDVARGLERSFRPTLIGAGAFYTNLEAWVSGSMFDGTPVVVGLGLLQALAWALFLGGAVHRFSRPMGGFRFSGFIRAGGRYFFRFLRLAIFSSVLYYLVFKISGWAFDLAGDWTRDVTSERTVLWVTLGLTAGTAVLLCVVHMAFAFAKVATVVENRRSMILAALRGFGFVLSHPGRVVGLYLGMGLLSAGLLAGYAWLAPGIGQASWTTVVLAFAGSQLYLAVRIGMMLALVGGQVALFQSDSKLGGSGL